MATTHVEITCLPILNTPNSLERTLQFFAFLSLSNEHAHINHTIKIEVLNNLEILITSYEGLCNSIKNLPDISQLSDQALISLIYPTLVAASGCEYNFTDFKISRQKENGHGHETLLSLYSNYVVV